MKNNKGRGSGLYLIIILIVAVLVAWLSVTQMKSLGIGGSSGDTKTEQSVDSEIDTEDPVGAANDAVDTINDRMLEAEDATDYE